LNTGCKSSLSKCLVTDIRTGHKSGVLQLLMELAHIPVFNPPGEVSGDNLSVHTGVQLSTLPATRKYETVPRTKTIFRFLWHLLPLLKGGVLCAVQPPNRIENILISALFATIPVRKTSSR